jgi:hypothetical protein
MTRPQKADRLVNAVGLHAFSAHQVKVHFERHAISKLQGQF